MTASHLEGHYGHLATVLAVGTGQCRRSDILTRQRTKLPQAALDDVRGVAQLTNPDELPE